MTLTHNLLKKALAPARNFLECSISPPLKKALHNVLYDGFQLRAKTPEYFYKLHNVPTGAMGGISYLVENEHSKDRDYLGVKERFYNCNAVILRYEEKGKKHEVMVHYNEKANSFDSLTSLLDLAVEKKIPTITIIQNAQALSSHSMVQRDLCLVARDTIVGECNKRGLAYEERAVADPNLIIMPKGVASLSPTLKAMLNFCSPAVSHISDNPTIYNTAIAETKKEEHRFAKVEQIIPLLSSSPRTSLLMAHSDEKIAVKERQFVLAH